MRHKGNGRLAKFLKNELRDFGSVIFQTNFVTTAGTFESDAADKAR